MNKQLLPVVCLLVAIAGLSLQVSAQVVAPSRDGGVAYEPSYTAQQLLAQDLRATDNKIYSTTEGFYVRYVDKDNKTVEIAPAQSAEDRIKEGVYYKDVFIPETLHVKDGGGEIACTVVAVGSGAYAMGEVHSVQYPRSCKEIKARAYNMSSIKEAIIPDWVETVEDMVFWNCKNVAKVEIGKGLKKAGQRIFEGCHNIATISVSPESTLFSASDNILYNKEQTKLFLCSPEARNANGERVVSISLPNGVKEIVPLAFKECIYLEHITLNEGLEKIGDDAFYKCDRLKEMNIPSTVNGIGLGAFGKLVKCEKFVVADGNETYEATSDGTNEGKLLVNKKSNTLIASLYKTAPSITIPDGIVEIAPRAFQYCDWAKSIQIPTSVERIGYSAFADMYGLTEIEIPEKVTEIPSYCISSCKKLTKVTLGKGVTLIGYAALSGNETMESEGGLLRVLATTPPAMGKDNDGDVYAWGDFAKKVTLEVPAESITKYKKDRYWRFFRNVYPVGNELVQPEATLQLTVSPGVLTVVAPEIAPIAVYTVSGEQIYATTTRECQIALPVGLYIVSYGTEMHKVQMY